MIEVDDLHKHYGNVAALAGLSFKVLPGRVTGFLGPNGAGKTTTMRIILGLDSPTSGTALVGGRRYQEIIRPLHEVGSLLDANALHLGRSARSHLLSIAQSNGIGRKRVTEVLELTGIEDVAARCVKGFSLGMRQRLGIAAALLGDPPVLIFDEPTNGLDPEGIHWIAMRWLYFRTGGPAQKGSLKALTKEIYGTARATGDFHNRWSCSTDDDGGSDEVERLI